MVAGVVLINYLAFKPGQGIIKYWTTGLGSLGKWSITKLVPDAALRLEERNCQILLSRFKNAYTEYFAFVNPLFCFECKVIDRNNAGDHTIYIGEVISAGVHREGKPLGLSETGMYYGG